MKLMNNVPEERLNCGFLYKSTKGRPYERVLWQIKFHLVNHGTQHRSEDAALLTGLGFLPGDIDFVYFLDEL